MYKEKTMPEVSSEMQNKSTDIVYDLAQNDNDDMPSMLEKTNSVRDPEELQYNINMNHIVRIDEVLYRVIDIRQESITIINIEASKLDIYLLPINFLFLLLENGKAMVVDEYQERAQPMELLSDLDKEKMSIKQQALERCIISIYPYFEELQNGGCRQQVENLMKELSISKTTAYRLIRRYLQSGREMESLIDQRKGWQNREKSENSCVCGAYFKDGSKSKVQNTPELYTIYDVYLQIYKKQAMYGMTIKGCYIRMLSEQFSIIDNSDGVTKRLVDKTERPSYERFKYYVLKQLGKEKLDMLRMGAREFKNNNRLLPGNTKQGSYPGKMIEIDEVEMDLALVSASDMFQNVGRAIMYCAVDVFSHCIVALNVAFENNSYEGFTGLMETLLYDHNVQTESYGVHIPAETFPSRFLPAAVRCDHGSEYVSKEFERAMRELNIEISLVPPGMGSMKPLVEQSFHQFQEKLRTGVIGNGVILKRVDSKHYDQSVLTIYDIRKIAYLYVEYHNTRLMENYPYTKDMVENGIQPSPASIWNYGMRNYTKPRTITEMNVDKYRYALLCGDRRFTIGFRGIRFKNLYYYKRIEWLDELMYNTGKKQEEIQGIRYDPRSINSIYYMRNGMLETIPLSEFRGENDSFKGMSWKELDEWQKKKTAMVDQYRESDLNKQIELHDEMRAVVEDAKAAQGVGKHKKKGIRDARRQERSRVKSEDMLSINAEYETEQIVSGQNCIGEADYDELGTESSTDAINRKETRLIGTEKTEQEIVVTDADSMEDFSDLFPDKWKRGKQT
ncbi:integrase catalytic domain-containing protein [Lacrimispora sp. 210928-DFI.3.58]|uniref:integrase catalytic domain-containing protein n=1 Tax=Lacrimispora sp. 210928-DFI.3.58 TaxID=2883214 RepID=UPI001D05CF34|nr:transposase family protein [Lacrimispora sp. 210928-DFI.3.58]MCB7319891.1 transposase family protein [Lacrimispora sp. 210928-DFI.3.58]